MPQRIQRRRTRGWRMPPNTIYVGRGTRFGNTFTVREYGRERAIELYQEWLDEVNRVAPEKYKALLESLRGKDLACWCPLTDSDGNPVPCHADVLLEIVNK